MSVTFNFFPNERLTLKNDETGCIEKTVIFNHELSVYDNFNIRAEYFNDAGADFKVRNEKDRKNIFLKFIPFRFEIDNSCVWE